MLTKPSPAKIAAAVADSAAIRAINRARVSSGDSLTQSLRHEQTSEGFFFGQWLSDSSAQVTLGTNESEEGGLIMEKQIYTVGERADKLCAVCNEERGHVVTSVTKRGQISRVSCPKCATISTFKGSTRTSPRPPAQDLLPYDRTHSYRAGQTMMHTTYGMGEVTALIEPQKMDVLFPDRVRRLIHAQ
jgi:hypothetical protein